MGKILNIEISVHNEEQLKFALSVEFRRSVHDLSINSFCIINIRNKLV